MFLNVSKEIEDDDENIVLMYKMLKKKLNMPFQKQLEKVAFFKCSIL